MKLNTDVSVLKGKTVLCAAIEMGGDVMDCIGAFADLKGDDNGWVDAPFTFEIDLDQNGRISLIPLVRYSQFQTIRLRTNRILATSVPSPNLVGMYFDVIQKSSVGAASDDLVPLTGDVPFDPSDPDEDAVPN